MVIASWKRVMTRGTYNLMLKRLSLCLLQARVRSCHGPDPTIVETIGSLSESRLQLTRIRTCRRLRTKDERSDSEANGIHGTMVLIVLGIPPPRSSIPTKPSDHGCLIVLRRTISYTRHESLTVLQGSPTSLVFSKGRRLFASRSQGRLHRAQWDLMDGHDRSDRV
jgi:hypothetical protein